MPTRFRRMTLPAAAGFAAWLILSALARWGSAAEGYNCVFKTTGAPVLDGRIAADEFWRDVPASPEFVRLGSNEKAFTRTWFKLAYSPDTLYLAVWCEEPHLDQVSVSAKDGGEVWSDDGVEIFISPPQSAEYLQLVTNLAGARYNGLGNQAAPVADWRVSCHRGENEYSFEIALPFAVLGRAPRAGEFWLANVGRNAYTCEDRHTTWAKLNGGFHSPAQFAPLFFPESAPLRLGQGLPDSQSADFSEISRLLAEHPEVASGLPARCAAGLKAAAQYESAFAPEKISTRRKQLALLLVELQLQIQHLQSQRWQKSTLAAFFGLK